MNERLHTPPHNDPIRAETPLIFLAGPIQGAPNWQGEMTAALLAANDELEIASPRRVSLDNEFIYAEQIAWEKQHLFRSHVHGVIAFWFAARDLSEPYEEGRDYAKTSRVEIGRIMGWRDIEPQPFPVVIGIEPGFELKNGQTRSEKYLRALAAEMGQPVHQSLDEMVQAILASVPIAKD